MVEATILSRLSEAQARGRQVSADSFAWLSQQLGVPRGAVEGIATFYSFLSAGALAEYDILLSDCVSDHLHGQQEFVQTLGSRLGVKPGETRPDGRVRLQLTSCTGMCDQAPSGLVNGRPLTRLTPSRAATIVELVQGQAPVATWPAELFEVEDNVRRTSLVLQGPFEPGEAMSEALRLGSAETLVRIEQSGLRGRGGAGFRTGLKWRLCREAPGERVVVCNADEGEPGTFKDRVLLRSFAQLVFEGMTVCARIVNARQGFLYLRGEYRYLAGELETILAERRSRGLLGERIMGIPDFSFDIGISVGAGAYVCGEESALIESLEGKRGIPRNRPPFPVTSGYCGQPTVVNNVETFAAAARIAVQGPEWFRSAGTEQSTGTKLLSVSGDCARPGVYEFPLGVALDEVLAASGAGEARAVQVSGPAGVLVGADEFGRRIAYEDLPTGGAIMVFGPNRDLLEILANHTRFFAHESCGFCTPCRVGTALQRDLVARIRDRGANRGDVEQLEAVAGLMKMASHCGLGQTAPNSVLDTLRRFPELYQERVASR